MKKVFFPFVVLLLITTPVFSQNEFGFKLGISSYDIQKSEIGNTEDLQLTIKDASYGFQAGLYGRLGLLGIYVQPEVLLNSNFVNYRLQDLNNLDTLDKIRTAKYQNLDIPLMLMITPSIFKIYAGPVGHYFINDISDFTKKDKIKEIFNNLTYGYQAGVGIEFSGVALDIRYESNFSKNIKTFIVDEKEFKIDKSPSRFIFSLWFKI